MSIELWLLAASMETQALTHAALASPPLPSTQAEHVACMEFVAVAFGRVLTSVQKAKALVLSHPRFPDIFAIATAATWAERQPCEAARLPSLGSV